MCQIIVNQLIVKDIQVPLSYKPKFISMKPSFEEVLQKILDFYTLRNSGKVKIIQVNALTEELNTCYEDLLPSLLLLSREQMIKFTDINKQSLVVIPKNIAA